MAEASKRYSLNKIEQGKMWTSFLLCMGGFVAIKAVEQLAQIDFGAWTPFAASLSPFLINSIRLWLKGRGIESLAKKK